VTLSWSAAAGTSFYALQVGTTSGVWNVFNASVGGVTTVSGSLPAGQYSWRVVAVGSTGATAASLDGQFTVAGCPTPLAPSALTATVSGGVVTLRWGAGGNAANVAYILEAGSAPGQSNIVSASLGALTGIATPAPSGTYYVRVRAQNGCGVSAPSNELVITVP
jgi:predicted phage tail protein